MTNADILNDYLSLVKQKSQEIKDEIDLCYQKHKHDENLEFILRDEVQMKIADFEFKYNMSAPQTLMDTKEAKICFVETIDIYLGLVRYTRQIFGEHIKNNQTVC